MRGLTPGETHEVSSDVKTLLDIRPSTEREEMRERARERERERKRLKQELKEADGA